MRFLIGVGLALGLVACTVHEVDECLPPCDELDQRRFAACVAEGIEGTCRAGNRRCCALEAGCVGDLDDQTVRTTASCESIVQDACYPPCDELDQSEYELCVDMGSSACPNPGDEECCALAADCLGELDDWIVSAEGCCSDSSECMGEQICDPEIFECVDPPASECGNEVQEAGEECDDGDTLVEPCPYGLMSCFVCSAECREIEGATSFCGDGRIDVAAGEDCDPPTSICDPTCQLPTPPMCTSPDECDDRDPCTADECDPAMGCFNIFIDADGDDFGPGTACGGDCDDLDPNVFPGAPEICGDRIDQNCDTLADEGCP